MALVVLHPAGCRARGSAGGSRPHVPPATRYQLPPDEPPPPPPENPPPPLNPLDPEDPGVETNVPAATVEKESMLDATSENPPEPQPPKQDTTDEPAEEEQPHA